MHWRYKRQGDIRTRCKRARTKEFNFELVAKMKKFLKGNISASITITISDEDSEYLSSLRKSGSDAESKANIVSFTMEEFEAYNPDASK